MRAQVNGADAGAYAFRRIAPADMPMLERWLKADHVARWWPDPAGQLAEIAQALKTGEADPYIVACGGVPIGYLQVYDPHADWALGPYVDQPRGSRGIDQFIGEAEMIGIGHGPLFIASMCERLFATGVPRMITDPDPANLRAVRAYEKAGFRKLDERTIPDGPVVLMARDRAN